MITKPPNSTRKVHLCTQNHSIQLQNRTQPQAPESNLAPDPQPRKKEVQSKRPNQHSTYEQEKEKEKTGGRRAHESVALGAARGAVGDDNGLEDVPVDLEVGAKPLAPRLPGEAADENLGEGGVSVWAAQVVQRRRAPAAATSSSSGPRRRPLRRHPCRGQPTRMHERARAQPQTLTLASSSS